MGLRDYDALTFDCYGTLIDWERGILAALRPLLQRTGISEEAALVAFSSRGYEATSLDALAAGLGNRKQTILHHYGSKELLLEAVLRVTVEELATAIDSALGRRGSPWQRLDAVVRAVFAHARRRPHTLGFLREVGRLGPRSVDRLNAALEPLTGRATEFLRTEMADGRRRDARRVALSAYASVIGAATEVEVLRSLGIEPNARLLVRRRRELLDYLASMLGVDPPAADTRRDPA